MSSFWMVCWSALLAASLALAPPCLPEAAAFALPTTPPCPPLETLRVPLPRAHGRGSCCARECARNRALGTCRRRHTPQLFRDAHRGSTRWRLGLVPVAWTSPLRVAPLSALAPVTVAPATAVAPAPPPFAPATAVAPAPPPVAPATAVTVAPATAVAPAPPPLPAPRALTLRVCVLVAKPQSAAPGASLPRRHLRVVREERRRGVCHLLDEALRRWGAGP